MDAILKSNPVELKYILHKYILQAEAIDNPGLYGGQLGVAILFYHYAKCSSDNIYSQFADELIDELIPKISQDEVVGFGNGLAGIAWGLYHIISKGFVEGDICESLLDVDQYIMRSDPRRFLDISFDRGLSGVLYYVNTRLSDAISKDCILPFDEVYLSDIKSFLLKNEGDDVDLLKQKEIFLKLYLEKKIVVVDDFVPLNKMWDSFFENPGTHYKPVKFVL